MSTSVFIQVGTCVLKEKVIIAVTFRADAQGIVM